MPDFNKGARRAIDDPLADDFSDRINRHIDAHFVRENKQEAEDAPRPYIGASGIGNVCPRAIQLEYIWQRFGNLPEGPGDWPAHIVRTFKAGHVFEDMAAAGIIGGGFDLSQYADVATKKQHGFSVWGGQFRGHVDGLIFNGPVPLPFPLIWECKALNDNGTEKVLSEGLMKSKPGYYAQVQINQLMLGIHSPTWFTIINKNTSKWYHTLIGHDPKFARELYAKAEYIFATTEAGRLVPRPYNDPMEFQCRQFCERWNGACWKLAA